MTLGLSAALRWYAGRLQELTPLIVHVDIIGEELSLDEAVQITIFRIIQEALNNVIKHAQASHVDFSLEFMENAARIRVRDNGCGFDLDLVRFSQRWTYFARAGRHGGTRRAAGRDS